MIKEGIGKLLGLLKNTLKNLLKMENLMEDEFLHLKIKNLEFFSMMES
jgi:hypothetical protein